jgi:hypothetical protein
MKFELSLFFPRGQSLPTLQRDPIAIFGKSMRNIYPPAEEKADGTFGFHTWRRLFCNGIQVSCGVGETETVPSRDYGSFLNPCGSELDKLGRLLYFPRSFLTASSALFAASPPGAPSFSRAFSSSAFLTSPAPFPRYCSTPAREAVRATWFSRGLRT